MKNFIKKGGFLFSFSWFFLQYPVEAATDTVSNTSNNDAIIVTGTRETHKKIRDSLSPIEVLNNRELLETGQTNVTSALAQLVPSITQPAVGQFVAAPTNFVSLRGLNPNQTLVLVNGKRRHNSSFLYIDGFADAATPTDLDLIAPELIDHIEVLKDGAAAQYGSDAIAGVVNIILKSDNHGGSARSQIGQTYAGDGLVGQAGFNKGFKIGHSGFFDIAFDFRHQNHTSRDGIDSRTQRHSLKVVGDPMATRYNLAINAGYDFGNGIEIYTTDSYSHRNSEVNQVYRTADRFPEVYPDGFMPIQKLSENDFSASLGLRGDNALGIHWDVNSTYGGNFIRNDLDKTANLGLYAATGSTPLSVHLNNYSTTQLNNTLDLSKELALPVIYSPLTLAAGFAHRYETYKTGAGDPASYLYGGTQARTGIIPAVAGSHSRNVYSGYLDLSAHLTKRWQVDLAGRYEYYSDFGSTLNGKASTRYDFTDQFALRATFSSGTRAPSLANEYFSTLSVGPDSASGTLGANSAAAKLLGAVPLKPEKATNITAGLVYSPLKNLHFTLDSYQIAIRNRIVSGPGISGEAALAALNAQGVTVASTLEAQNISAWFFTNGASTRTRGLDFTASYHSRFENFGIVDWDIALNINATTIRHVNQLANGMSALNAQTRAYLTSSTPKNRITFGGRWESFSKKWDVSLHEQRFGQTTDEMTWYQGPNAYSMTDFNRIHNHPRWITNLEIGYRPIEKLRVAIGANNLFNAHTTRIPAANGYYGSGKYDGAASQIGVNGGFYYLQTSYQF
ncbi:MAG: TonB-dependent receptor [Zymomonas mobilis]|uniref:TonB-dependent receptor plug domain-containing protein n=1 Tax=Zymomonas mobilis TaxID=542 RepID=UPI0039EA3D77